MTQLDTAPEVERLRGETMAAQTLLSSLMVGLTESGVLDRGSALRIFDAAATALETHAIKGGKPALEALGIIETIRAEFAAPSPGPARPR